MSTKHPSHGDPDRADDSIKTKRVWVKVITPEHAIGHGRDHNKNSILPHQCQAYGTSKKHLPRMSMHLCVHYHVRAGFIVHIGGIARRNKDAKMAGQAPMYWIYQDTEEGGIDWVLPWVVTTSTWNGREWFIECSNESCISRWLFEPFSFRPSQEQWYAEVFFQYETHPFEVHL